MTYTPSEDSDLSGHLLSLIRVFTVYMKKPFLSYPLSTQRKLRSDLADAQADLSLCWAHMLFCYFSHAVVQIWRTAYGYWALHYSDKLRKWMHQTQMCSPSSPGYLCLQNKLSYHTLWMITGKCKLEGKIEEIVHLQDQIFPYFELRAKMRYCNVICGAPTTVKVKGLR